MSALIANFLDQGYYVNLVSRIVIFAIAGVGLNLALGYGGMVSLGHAAFFGIGGYITGIAATHFSESSEFIAGFGGSNEMLTDLAYRYLHYCVSCFIYWPDFASNKRGIFHNDYPGVRTNGVLFRHLLAKLWW